MWKRVRFAREAREVAEALLRMKREEGRNPIWGITPLGWYVAWWEEEGYDSRGPEEKA
jgi:hypothetical protein